LMPSDAAGVGKFMLAHHVGGMILGGSFGYAQGGAPGAMVGGIGGLAGVAVLPPLILRAAMTQPGRKLVQQLFKEIPGRTVDPMSVIPALTNFLVAQARAPKKMTPAMEEAQ